MSIKNKIISELRAVSEDLSAAQKLEPTILLATSALETANSKETFKDRVIENAAEGFRALGRLGDKFATFSAVGGLVRMWTKSKIPSIINREYSPEFEMTPELSKKEDVKINDPLECGGTRQAPHLNK